MLKTIFEISALVLIALGFILEHKLVNFEDKIFSAVKKIVKSKRRKASRRIAIESAGLMDMSA